MAEEKITLIDDLEPSLLDTYEKLNVANYICHEACSEFYKLYNEKWIPATYIEFIFGEYKKYSFQSNETVKEFFRLYKPSDIPAIIASYMRTTLCIIGNKRTRQGEDFYKVVNEDLVDVRLSSKNIYGNNNKPLYSALEKIANHIRNTDELVTHKDLYEKFMMKKYIDGVLNVKGLKKVNKKAINNANVEPPKSDYLVGEKTNIPKQSGKVVKIFFPKLSLPSAYPTSQDRSRVNTERVARKFMRIDDEVTLINKYKFSSIKYHKSFIEKRKLAQKPPKKNFDFDF